jgi:hypothetical protein
MKQRNLKNFFNFREKDNKGFESISSCKMYNVSVFSKSSKTFNEWNFNSSHIIECVEYDYDKKWYERTAVSGN